MTKLERCERIAREQLERTGNEEEGGAAAEWTLEDGAILWHFAKTHFNGDTFCHPAWGRYMRSLNA